MARDSRRADHREETPVYRLGAPTARSTGPATSRAAAGRIDAETVEFTNFDHNDANDLEAAILTPQDPLYERDELARQVSASGITSVSGDDVVGDRLFEPYRVRTATCWSPRSCQTRTWSTRR